MLLKREREARLTRRPSYSWPLPSSATVMPQNEAYENQNLWTKTGKEVSYSCYRGVADLIHGHCLVLATLVRRPLVQETSPKGGHVVENKAGSRVRGKK